MGATARAEGWNQPGSYVEETRRLGISFVLVLPLIVLYQVGIVQAGSTTRNIAEVWMTGPLAVLGMPAATAINILTLGTLFYGLWESQRRGSLSVTFLGVMLVESFLYALLMYVGVSAATRVLHEVAVDYLSMGEAPGRQLLLLLGAGVYEEILFRLILIGGGMLLLRGVFLWNTAVCAVLLLVVSSLLFSAAHHVGSHAESFDTFVFLFRTLCGAMLGLIFLSRGFGIAVWTHALYNVLVLVST